MNLNVRLIGWDSQVAMPTCKKLESCFLAGDVLTLPRFGVLLARRKEHGILGKAAGRLCCSFSQGQRISGPQIIFFALAHQVTDLIIKP